VIRRYAVVQRVDPGALHLSHLLSRHWTRRGAALAAIRAERRVRRALGPKADEVLAGITYVVHTLDR
jgi:hypothetical protein